MPLTGQHHRRQLAPWRPSVKPTKPLSDSAGRRAICRSRLSQESSSWNVRAQGGGQQSQGRPRRDRAYTRVALGLQTRRSLAAGGGQRRSPRAEGGRWSGWLLTRSWGRGREASPLPRTPPPARPGQDRAPAHQLPQGHGHTRGHTRSRSRSRSQSPSPAEQPG
ncbi:tetratricopeptide repeat protein 14 homolog [Canis lupus familiaris]|uniref:tetratricopeptide repeat protein 14 homolog n=1 Tax=Canis lupus familiaris TaxID=9615 RepID=UPI0018F70CF0|nr:tetratricopeptide repeat protein 14 homolog [Canis lupus familiaris]